MTFSRLVQVGLALAATAVLIVSLSRDIEPTFTQAATNVSRVSPVTPVTNVQAVHRDGQTFVTWDEAPAYALSGQRSAQSIAGQRVEWGKRVQYRIYRSAQPIETVRGSTPIGTAQPLSGWNADFHGAYPTPTLPAFRYCISDNGALLPDGKGLYVHNPKAAGAAFYAVTIVVDSAESPVATEGSRTQQAVTESVGAGTPIRQRVEKPEVLLYIEKPELQLYTRWEAPPRANRENQPFDYVVGIPQGVKNPSTVGIHMHGWGGNLLSEYGWWFNAESGAILVASNQMPYDWWTGYHENLFVRPLRTAADWQSGVVRPYTQARLLAFVDWLATTRPIDLKRTFAAGQSMGGSGSLMLAIRYPDRVAWVASWVGVHRPKLSGNFVESYAAVYGPLESNVKYEDGTPVWEFFDDTAYLRKTVGKGLGLLVFSNGKNDGAIGWQQAVDFFRVLQETRQPHVFLWGQHGHGERAYMPTGGERNMTLDLRTDRSLPAFTRSSLDDNPGDGNPANGVPTGQSNLFLSWDPGTIEDTADRWEVTVSVRKDAPSQSARVDITPRRCQQFKPAPGERIAWTNSVGGRVIQSGELTVDKDGLVTVPEATIGPSGNRIRLTRAPASAVSERARTLRPPLSLHE